MDENTESFLRSNRVQKTNATVLILLGLFQVVGGLTQDTLPWMLFYVIAGLGVAISGGFFLRNTINSADQ